MLKLSRKTEYCILALRHLSRQEDRSATVKDLAAALKLSRPLLAKLLQELARKRIVISSQGASGGFVLHKNLNRLSLMELVEIIDGPVGLTATGFRPGSAPLNSGASPAGRTWSNTRPTPSGPVRATIARQVITRVLAPPGGEIGRASCRERVFSSV